MLVGCLLIGVVLGFVATVLVGTVFAMAGVVSWWVPGLALIVLVLGVVVGRVAR